MAESKTVQHQSAKKHLQSQFLMCKSFWQVQYFKFYCIINTKKALKKSLKKSLE